MRQTASVFVGLLGGLVVLASSALAGKWVGAPAAELGLQEQAINVPAGLELTVESLTADGHALVLLFWSTECPTCPKVIPQVNRLRAALRNEPVRFLSVMSESVEQVQKFLAGELKMNTMIGFDDQFATNGRFFVTSVPMAVIINPDGVIAARTHALNLSVGAIRAAIRGETPNLELAPSHESLLPSEPITQPSIYEMSVRPADPNKARLMRQVGGLQMEGFTLREALRVAYGVSQQLIISDSLLLDAKYDFVVFPPNEETERVQELLRELISTTFDTEPSFETRTLPIYTLRTPNGPGPGLKTARPARAAGELTPGRLSGTNLNMQAISFYLSEAAGWTPMVDETGLEGRYDFEITWRAGDMEAFKRAVRNELGIVMESGEREFEALVAERVSEGAVSVE